jgi:hypothetical protein
MADSDKIPAVSGVCNVFNGKILRMYWAPDGAAGSMEACCRKKANGHGLSYWMCMSLCYFCCKKLIIEYECEESDTGSRDEPIDQERDYPTTTVNDHGIAFTTSAYGAPLPIVFGADKLTGNVFWASKVRKHITTTTTDGKTVNQYYYTLDFAFGICEGEINGVLRMWLGDKIIIDNSADTDENGVMQVNADGFIAGRQIDLTDPTGPLRNLTASQRQTKISVLAGTETQLPEGAMVTREGYDSCPGYRGVAYVLFENFIVTGTSIPNIYVEVTSNTDSTIPRLYGTFTSSPEVFDRPVGDAVLVDLAYDNIYVPAKDNNGTATPASGQGFAIYENNSLERTDEVEILVTESIPLTYRVTRILPGSGYLMTHYRDGNAGIMRVWNPFAKVFVDEFGPGGTVGGHSLANGMAALGEGSLTFGGFDPVTGLPTDVFVGIGQVNSSVGFMTVDPDGQMTFVSTLNATLPATHNRAVYYPGKKELIAAHPTFVDGASTAGQHIMILSGASSVGATTYSICRITVHSDTATLAAPEYALMDTINADDLIGAGFDHSIQLMLVDPSDWCLVLFFYSASDYGPIVAKYNPFTGAIVWKTQAPGLGSMQGSDMAHLAGSSYAWVGTDSKIYKLNMTSGTVETLTESMSSESLPARAGEAQFYNGVENTITYVSNEASKQVVKVYLERIERSTIEVASIVQLLLERVGLVGTDMDIEDLTALTLTGYTISQKQSLRTSFAELGQAFKFDVIESNGRIKYKTRGTVPTVTVPARHLGASDEGQWLQAESENDISRYRKINLTYRDIDREYKNNVQSVILPRYGSSTFDNDAAIDVSVPIVLDATTAKKLAEILIYSKLIYETTYRFKLPPYYLDLDPGDVIELDVNGEADPTTVRVRRTTIGADNSIEVEASEEDPDIYTDTVNLFGAAGRYEDSIFPEVPPRVDVCVLDIPFLDDTAAAATVSSDYLWCVFLNAKSSAVLNYDIGVQIDGTTPYTIKKPDNFPTWGYVVTPPTYRSSQFSTDYESTLVVRIVSDSGLALASTTEANLLQANQYNLAYVGGELLQFANAVDNGDGTWTLTTLHRSKFGTDPAYGLATAGSKFILLGDSTGVLDTGAIRRINVPSGDPKHVVQFFLRSTNPMQPAPVRFFNSLNLSAWAVGDLNATWNGNDAEITWQRRTRYDGGWEDDGSDAVDVNQIDESYVLYFHSDFDAFDASNPDTYWRRVEVSTNSYTYAEADQTADGYDGTTTDLLISIYQQGGVEGHRYGMTRSTYLDSR